jgi:D-sedoheptulose 7-phosphate isomerase
MRPKLLFYATLKTKRIEMRSFKDIAEEHSRVLKASLEIFQQAFKPSVEICKNALLSQNKLLICGNGGSAADSQHFAAELVGRYETERIALPAIALSVDTSIITALGNDYGFEEIFARQVIAMGRPGDVLLAISTSGNSPNVIKAALTAKNLEMKVIAFTGQDGGRLAEISDIVFAVPSKRTARIQEIHEICLHGLAEAIESYMAADPQNRISS